MTQESGAGRTRSLKKQRAKEPPLSLRSHTGHLPSMTPGSACFSSVSISIFKNVSCFYNEQRLVVRSDGCFVYTCLMVNSIKDILREIQTRLWQMEVRLSVFFQLP